MDTFVVGSFITHFKRDCSGFPPALKPCSTPECFEIPAFWDVIRNWGGSSPHSCPGALMELCGRTSLATVQCLSMQMQQMQQMQQQQQQHLSTGRLSLTPTYTCWKGRSHDAPSWFPHESRFSVPPPTSLHPSFSPLLLLLACSQGKKRLKCHFDAFFFPHEKNKTTTTQPKSRSVILKQRPQVVYRLR